MFSSSKHNDTKRTTAFRPEFVLATINVIAVTVMVAVFVQFHSFIATHGTSLWLHGLAVGIELFVLFEVSWWYTCRFIPSQITSSKQNPTDNMLDSVHMIREQIEQSPLFTSIDLKHQEQIQTSVEHAQTIEQLQQLLETVMNSLESLENDLNTLNNDQTQNTGALLNFATSKE